MGFSTAALGQEGMMSKIRVNTNEKYIWVDYLRVIATFSVILLHSAAPLLYKYNELSGVHWMIGNVYDSMARMCVPIFFMISGYLLLGKNEPLKLFFSKRVNKVLLPLIAWSIIYILWKAYYEGSSDISFYSFYSIVLTPAYYHLWFLYAIIGVYLFLPILRIVVEKSDYNLMYYYVFLWFIAVSIIPVGEKITGIDSRIDLLAISGYSGYLVLGFLLGRLEITKKMALVGVAVFVFCMSITAVGTYFMTTNNEGKFVEYLYGYLTPNVIFMSSSIFVITKYFVGNFDVLSNGRMLSVLKSFSSASLGIYLIHTVFLYLLKEGDLGVVVSGVEWHPAIGIPVTALVTFMLSYLSICVLRKIPVLNKISP